MHSKSRKKPDTTRVDLARRRRHTTMIVGPTGGGKTVVLDTLKAARLKAEGVVVKYYVINPKAQPLNELYGVMDPVTRDWTDGPYLGVLRCCGAFTPSTRLVAIARCRGWFLCRI